MRNNPHMQSLRRTIRDEIFVAYSSDVIDEQTKRVAARSVNCCQYANQISAKMHKRATESTIRKLLTEHNSHDIYVGCILSLASTFFLFSCAVVVIR